MRRHVCFTVLFAFAAVAAQAAGYSYQTLWVDGAVSTSPAGINEQGVIVGSYQMERGNSLLIRPFRYENGVYTTPPSIEPASFSYDDVNDARNMAANIGHRDFTTEAFFIERGRRTLLAVPGAVQTHAYALNDLDTVVGAYHHDPDQFGILATSAFTWNARDGFKTFDVQGATGRLTIAWGINRVGTTVGVIADAELVYRGFVRTRSGQVTIVEYPGSPYTQLMGINAQGDAVGFYQDPTDFILRGFLWRKGVFTPVGPADAANGSYPYKITDDGRVLGYYMDANYRSIGFLATPLP